MSTLTMCRRACSVFASLTLSAGLVVIAAEGSSAAGCETCIAGARSAGIATNVLNGVAATSRSQAWAVGYSGNGSVDKALVERWNGGRWRIWGSPNPGTGSTLHGVASVSRTSAWAVGVVTHRVGAGTLIEHWNGRTWRVQASQNPAPGPDLLTGVAALSNSNAWAVGSYALGGHTLIEHWNGRRWRVQASPSPATFSNVLTSVTAISPSDVWAVGYTIDKSGSWRTLIEHWNGRRWRAQASPSPGTQSNQLEGIAATGRSSAWAVGSTTTGGVQSALILRWNGRRWKTQPSPTSAFGIALQSTAKVSGGGLWAAGFTGSRTIAEHWNGRKWKIQHTPDPIFSADPQLAFNGVAALSGSNAWAVGYSGEQFSPGSRTLIEHWNGRTWRVEPSPSRLATRRAAARTTLLSGSSGTRRWVERYNGQGNNLSNDDAACCVAVSPNGKLVFVTGQSNGRYSLDWATVAYNATTGRPAWKKRYNGPDTMGDSASSIAVSPGGRTVYVTGYSTGKISGQDYLTIAYNATTGATRWVRRYNGPANGMDTANSVTVSPNGAKVYVTGGSMDSATGWQYATVAYSAAGARLWVRRYNGPGNGTGAATTVTASRGGDKVFVTGYSMGEGTNTDYATIAYSATGARLWVRRYNGPGNGPDQALSMAVSPAGDTVFVTGYTDAVNSPQQFTTIAYDAATGATLWLRSYDGPYNGADSANSVAVSPTGATVFVTGSSYGKTSTNDYTTIAYNAATGATLWRQRYTGPDVNSEARWAAVSPSGKIVYVTGVSYAPGLLNDYATVAYNAATGAQVWVRRYNGPASNNDGASSVAVSPVTGAVYVTGESMGRSGSQDYLTIGYSP